jgi:uncharacterized membrane protein (DUF2068 family)
MTPARHEPARAALPGTTQPKRFRPTFHYELLACGVAGHELVGTDAAELRPQDAVVARPGPDGLRWHRCLRCDSWLALPPPELPSRPVAPDRDEVQLPLRGKALRDKFVLRVIAIDRAVHFVVLAVIAVAIFLFAANQTSLRGPAFKVLADLQGGLGGPTQDPGHGLIHELRRLFSVQHGTLIKIAIVVVAYAILEGLEAVGLWFARRWAEYLTFVATTLLLPIEVYELTHTLSPLKIVTLVLNIAVVVYLLLASGCSGCAAARAPNARSASATWAGRRSSARPPAPYLSRRPVIEMPRALRAPQ